MHVRTFFKPRGLRTCLEFTMQWLCNLVYVHRTIFSYANSWIFLFCFASCFITKSPNIHGVTLTKYLSLLICFNHWTVIKCSKMFFIVDRCVWNSTLSAPKLAADWVAHSWIFGTSSVYYDPRTAFALVRYAGGAGMSRGSNSHSERGGGTDYHRFFFLLFHLLKILLYNKIFYFQS